MSKESVGPDRTVFVNRRRFTLPDATPTGADIAALIGVPADNAVVERETADGLIAIPLDAPLSIDDGQAFLVTRQFIMGGCPGSCGNASTRS